ERWHDYRDVDVVVAVRPAGAARSADAHIALQMKPATKLYNAWTAGVPAVLSPDVAFLELRESPLDFLEATDAGEVLDALARLKASPDLRRAMMEHGGHRAKSFTIDCIAARWMQIIQEQIVPHAERRLGA